MLSSDGKGGKNGGLGRDPSHGGVAFSEGESLPRAPNPSQGFRREGDEEEKVSPSGGGGGTKL